MENISIRETYKGWVMQLDFSFSKEVELKDLEDATVVADQFHQWVVQFQKYAAPTMKAEKNE
jgi:hypothetical protein